MYFISKSLYFTFYKLAATSAFSHYLNSFLEEISFSSEPLQLRSPRLWDTWLLPHFCEVEHGTVTSLSARPLVISVLSLRPMLVHLYQLPLREKKSSTKYADKFFWVNMAGESSFPSNFPLQSRA